MKPLKPGEEVKITVVSAEGAVEKRKTVKEILMSQYPYAILLQAYRLWFK